MESSPHSSEQDEVPDPAEGSPQQVSQSVSADHREENSTEAYDAEESMVNPPLPAELGAMECLVLRGDAIGSTAYTHRWVLSTLLTITEALPKYLATDEKCENGDDNKCAEEENIVTEHSEMQQTSQVNSIMELEENVENAACQLWDMTAEPDVVTYLLNLDVVDVLQLANEIITLSRAPRLTEVVVGVVANLCCQADGCEKVMQSEFLRTSCLGILNTTDDVPTLVEAFRLLKLLLWHATYRVALEERCRCPLVMALKGHESIKEALVFMLKNSLKDNLLNALFEFLESLLYLWLPPDQCYMAAHYSESGLIEGVVLAMRHFMKEWEKSGAQEEPTAINRGVHILYSFVATPAVHTIRSFDQYESLLEPVLVRYVEHMAKVEKVEELFEERAEWLVYALGLCELLVPTMRHPNILLHVGKLLALTHGESYHYVAVPSQTKQELGNIEEGRTRHKSEKQHRRRSSTRRRNSSFSQDDHMETNNPHEKTSVCNKQKAETSFKGNKDKIHESHHHYHRRHHHHHHHPHHHHHHRHKTDSCNTQDEDHELETGKLPEDSQCSALRDTCTTLDRDSLGESSKCDNPCIRHRGCKEKDTDCISHTLRESLGDYCVRVVRCCPDLCTVLTVVNECHVHEVELFFQAVRLQEPTLVGQLQEQLLDSGAHNRLVTILSDMYA